MKYNLESLEKFKMVSPQVSYGAENTVYPPSTLERPQNSKGFICM